MVKICLLKKVEPLGDAGTVVEVAEGYAINFLFPQKMARRATAHDEVKQQQIVEKRAADAVRRQKILGYVENSLAPLASKTAVKVEVNAMAGGKLNEPITSLQLAEALQKQFKQLDVLSPDEFAFALPSRLDYTGKYSFDVTIKPRQAEESVTIPIIVDIVSISKTRRAKRSKENPSKNTKSETRNQEAK